MRRGTSRRQFQKFESAQDRMIERCFNDRRAQAFARKRALAEKKVADKTR